MARNPKASQRISKAKTAAGPLGEFAGGVDTTLEIDWVSSIVVRRLEVTPAAIPAFGTATIRWEIEASPIVRLTLGGVRVNHSGSMAVQPTETQTFRLLASAGNQSRYLGDVTVQVLHDHCMRTAALHVEKLFAGALKGEINARTDVRFRQVLKDGVWQLSEPAAAISDGRLNFSAYLLGIVDNLPNPDVDIRGSFNLGVAPTLEGRISILPKNELVARDIDVSVDITFPWYTYLIPGAMLAVPIAADMRKEEAKVAVSDGIKKFVSSLNFVPPGPGLTLHAARMYVDGYGDGTVELEYCPPPLPGIGG